MEIKGLMLRFPLAAALCVCVLRVCPAEEARWTHEMPAKTNEKPLATPYGELAETFRDPFGKVQTGCYWYWLCGNISAEGAVKDLEAMKRAGIDRPYIGDVGDRTFLNTRGTVANGSPEWDRAMQASFETATRLGMDIGIFNSPGWSMSGGPWVASDAAMRRFVASSTVVEGPASEARLPMPEFECAKPEEYRDVVALAYPIGDDWTMRLEKRRVKDELTSKSGEPVVVELESEKDFTAQSAEVAMKGGLVSGSVIVEVPDGNGWRKLGETQFSRTNYGTGVGFSPRAPIIVSFAPVTARRFRVTVKPGHARNTPTFESVAVCAAPLVAQAFEKSLAKMFESPLPSWAHYKWPEEAECVPGTAFDPEKAVVLRGKVASDGTLTWDVPEGKWIAYRFGIAPTGARNGPAYPDASGLEIDKMSRKHVAFHFDSYLGRILSATPEERRKCIGHAILDSYEMGGQNYTDGFADKFRASFGYDPVPYLPTLFGAAVASRMESDRFLWDLRRFVADEVAYSYVGGLREASNAHGLETWLENYGHWGFPGEFLQYGGQSDEVAGEYWSEGSLGNIENRAASSCAHTYGKNLVWAESHTAGGRQFQRGPMDMKTRTDRFFAEGINATILHFFAHQPDERAPGLIEGFGNEFNRHNTWFEHMDLFTGYLKRCGWMLRQGLNVADVAYFIGEDTPCMTGVVDPALPQGRQFDYINAEVLKESAGVDAMGRIVLPHGTAYEVLVLPKLDAMRPEMLACIERLVNAGAFVIGPKPGRSPSLAGQPRSDEMVKEIAGRLWGDVDGKNVKHAKRGKGTIAWNMSLAEALGMCGSEPDAAFAPGNPLVFAHRTMPGAEIYFLSNQSGREIGTADVSFRVAGRVPELWNAATGERRRASGWREENGRTTVPLKLARMESVFVVFPAEDAGLAPAADGQDAGRHVEPIEISGPWRLAFQSDSLHRGPAEEVVLPKLVDLKDSSDERIKHYAGKIVYRNRFTCEGGRSILDLGDVSVTAKVRVNGKYAGGTCFAPYRLDITPFVRKGENELEIEVCNLWFNRLVGDFGDPDRPTWVTRPCCGKNTGLLKSGLLGPVRIHK